MPAFVTSVEADGQRLVATVPSDRVDAAAAWAVSLREAGTIDRYSLSGTSLEDIYVGVVGDTGPADDETAAPRPRSRACPRCVATAC